MSVYIFAVQHTYRTPPTRDTAPCSFFFRKLVSSIARNCKLSRSKNSYLRRTKQEDRNLLRSYGYFALLALLALAVRCYELRAFFCPKSPNFDHNTGKIYTTPDCVMRRALPQPLLLLQYIGFFLELPLH